MRIRPERPDDMAAIDAVTRAAFADHPHSDQTEHRIVERLRVDQQQHRDIVAMREAETPVDDSKHRPTSVDPLLKGAGRATGQTAAAVKRGKTMTKYQHQATERRQETA